MIALWILWGCLNNRCVSLYFHRKCLRLTSVFLDKPIFEYDYEHLDRFVLFKGEKEYVFLGFSGVLLHFRTVRLLNCCMFEIHQLLYLRYRTVPLRCWYQVFIIQQNIYYRTGNTSDIYSRSWSCTGLGLSVIKYWRYDAVPIRY